MRHARTGWLGALALSTAMALSLAGPMYARAEVEAPETETVAASDVVLSAQDVVEEEVELYINLDNNDDDPYVDDATCGFAFTTFSAYDSAVWELYAVGPGDDGQRVRLSGDLAGQADYFQQGEEHADVALAKICDEYLKEVENPQILVRVSLVRGGSAFATEERYFDIRRPHVEVNFCWNDDVNKVLMGSDISTNSENQIFVYSSAHRWGESCTCVITQVSSSNESVITGSADEEWSSCSIRGNGFGTATLTFTYKCLEYPELSGTFERTFQVVDQLYNAYMHTADYGYYALRNTDVDYYTTIDNSVWNDDKGYAESYDTLLDGDSVVYEIEHAPEGTVLTPDANDPLHFTIRVPEEANEYDDVYVTLTIVGANGEVRYTCTNNIATVRTAYYSAISLINAKTGEALESNITLEEGQTIAIKPQVFLISASGREEASDLPWQVTGTGDGIAVQAVDGTFQVSYTGEPTDSWFVLEYVADDGSWNNVQVSVYAPGTAPVDCEHAWTMSLESAPTEEQPGLLVQTCINCNERHEHEVGLPEGGETYYATQKPTFFNLFHMLFSSNLNDIASADAGNVIYFTRCFYNLFNNDCAYTYLSYSDLMDEVDSLFAAPQIHEAVEQYLEGTPYYYLSGDELVMPNGGGTGDDSMLKMTSMEGTSTGKILHGVWGELIGTEKPEGTEDVDYFGIEFYDEGDSSHMQYYRIDERVRLVLNGEHQIVAYEEDTVQDLADVATISGTEKTFLYDAKSEPNPGIMFRAKLNNGAWLDPGVDYEVTQCDVDTEHGTVAVTIGGIGSYTGELHATLHIAPITVTVTDVPFHKANDDKDPLSITKNAYETVTAVIDGEERTLERFKDYIPDYAGDLCIGANKPLLISGTGAYTGFVPNVATYRIVGDISKATVSIGSLTYTGKALSPKVTVQLLGGAGKYYFQDETLKNGTDYTVSYKNSAGKTVSSITSAGTYTAVITGKGLYKGSISKDFKVAAKSISKLNVTAAKAKTYTGKALTPNVIIKDGKTTLKAGTHYTLSYKNAKGKAVAAKDLKAAGTYKVTVKMKGNYTGSNSKTTFTINKAANPLKVTAKKPTVSPKKYNKQGIQTIALKNAMAVSKAQGKLTFAKISGNGKITISKAGEITVKKGLKKGTYKVKFKVTAAGKANYKAGSKTVTVSIIVK